MSRKTGPEAGFFSNFVEKYSFEILMTVLIGFLLFLYVLWILNNDLAVFVENQDHLPKALFFYKHLHAAAGDFLKAYISISAADSYWPLVRSPLTYLLTGLVNCWSGFSIFKAQLAFFLFFLATVLGTYLIAETIAGKKAAFFAAALVGLNPFIFHYALIYNQDLPLTAMVVLGIYFLSLWSDFKNRAASLCLGLIFGLGLLTKPTFIAFLGGPLCFCLYRTFCPPRSESENKGKRAAVVFSRQIMINILFFFLVFTAVALTWFGFKLKWLLPNFRYELLAYRRFNDPRNNFLFYPVGFYVKSGLILFGLFFAGLPAAFKPKNKAAAIVFCWFICSYLFLSLIANKADRYALPLLPATAVISAVGILKIKNAVFKKYIIATSLVLLLAQFVYSGFFYKNESFLLAGFCNFLCVKRHDPPQKYWNSAEGRAYIAFFKEKLKGEDSERLSKEKLLDYYNFIENTPNRNIKLKPWFRLSLNNAFKQYLLFKQPELLIKTLPDEDLSLFFIEHDKPKKPD